MILSLFCEIGLVVRSSLMKVVPLAGCRDACSKKDFGI